MLDGIFNGVVAPAVYVIFVFFFTDTPIRILLF